LLLEIDGIRSGYGRLEVLHGISLAVDDGEVVALLGANGAGKTTTLRVCSGLLPTWSGAVRFDGRDLAKLKTEQRAAIGLGHLPEGRGILHTLSVRENLHLSTVVRHDGRRAIEADLERMLEMFPILRQRLGQPAGSLSGGQQQMLTVARAMMARPRLLMIDELSFGLAPLLVDQLLSTIGDLRKLGTSFLLVEQHASVLDVSDRAYVLRTGENQLDGRSIDLKHDPTLVRSYLGA
jgi:branched-chain amino acid transport system ATP-binding protein